MKLSAIAHQDWINMILEEWMNKNRIFLEDYDNVISHKDKQVLKYFSNDSNGKSHFPKKYKYLDTWCIIEGNLAIGYNQNPSTGFELILYQLNDKEIEKYNKFVI